MRAKITTGIYAAQIAMTIGTPGIWAATKKPEKRPEVPHVELNATGQKLQARYSEQLQNYQNIIMNGGVCGRRAFFGRFILRSFGIPTLARPQKGHATLVHWTPDGWVINLGAGWGWGWTIFGEDTDFLASTQARKSEQNYLQVLRAQWAGAVLGETKTFGFNDDVPAAGKYAFSARVVTTSADQHLFVAADDARESTDIAVPFTVGMWDNTPAVEVSLVKGPNVLRFSRTDPLKGISIKDFTLTPVK